MLSNIGFETKYVPLGPEANVFSGLAPFNVSLATPEWSEIGVPPAFLMFAFSLLSDSRSVAAIPPITQECQNAANDCLSVILPNALDYTGLEENYTRPIEYNQDATTYVVKNATGYQLEYIPLQDDTFEVDDCQILGRFPSLFFVKMCLKNVDGDLLAGIRYVAKYVLTDRMDCMSKRDCTTRVVQHQTLGRRTGCENETSRVHAFSYYNI